MFLSVKALVVITAFSPGLAISGSKREGQITGAEQQKPPQAAYAFVDPKRAAKISEKRAAMKPALAPQKRVAKTSEALRVHAKQNQSNLVVKQKNQTAAQPAKTKLLNRTAAAQQSAPKKVALKSEGNTTKQHTVRLNDKTDLDEAAGMQFVLENVDKLETRKEESKTEQKQAQPVVERDDEKTDNSVAHAAQVAEHARIKAAADQKRALFQAKLRAQEVGTTEMPPLEEVGSTEDPDSEAGVLHEEEAKVAQKFAQAVETTASTTGAVAVADTMSAVAEGSGAAAVATGSAAVVNGAVESTTLAPSVVTFAAAEKDSAVEAANVVTAGATVTTGATGTTTGGLPFQPWSRACDQHNVRIAFLATALAMLGSGMFSHV